MKKTGKILVFIMMAILIIVMIVNNNSSAEVVTFSSTTQTINKGETVTVVIAGENIRYCHGDVKYDNEFLEYESSNIDIGGSNTEGRIAIDYGSTSSEVDVKRINSIELKFKAKAPTEETTISVVDKFEIQLPAGDADEDGIKKDTILNLTNLVAPINITINEVTPQFEAPSIDVSQVTIEEGKSQTVVIGNQDKIGEYSWSTADGNIATVGEKDGNIQGVKEGDTKVTLTSQGGNKEIEVHVTKAQQDNPQPGNAPKLSTNSITIQKDSDPYTITSDIDVNWLISNESVIESVSSDSKRIVIKPIGAGNAKVIAKAQSDESLQTTVDVKVTDPSSGNTENNGQNNNQNNGQNNNQNNGQNNNQNNGQNNNQGNEQNNNQGNEQNNNQGNSQNAGSNASNKGNNGQSTTSTTNNAGVKNSSSSANEVVPATGESSVGTIAVLVVATLIIASIVFRKKSRIK